MAISTIKKWGNSPSVRLPAGVMAAASLNINDTVEITVEPTGRIVIEPTRAQVYSLEALLAGVTKSNIHERQDFGPATGQELI